MGRVRWPRLASGLMSPEWGDGQHGAKAQQVEHCAILHQVAAHRIGVGLEDAGSLIHRGFGGDNALNGYGIKHHDGRRQRAPGIPALLPAAERLCKQHAERKEREKGKHTAQIKRPVDTAAQQAYGNGRGHPTVLASRPRRWMARSKGTVSIQNMRAYRYTCAAMAAVHFAASRPDPQCYLQAAARNAVMPAWLIR